MVEYAVVTSKSFGETLLSNWQDMTRFFSDMPFYWYLVAAASLILFIKALSGKKI
ncbi:MAG: hypothetical protein GWN55_00570 [Phycisphaerae bacterium]|nr:hypothetical protein [Gammaproteobacteria bacterium]NIQ09729.1 hypothetical protein [Gammaproteobacteria bacterium]NIU99825.1 hypothetical protein [Phycisphaerae bacterium]NIV68849.1 hypothetical protein [Phycisphaerae bacterium]NIY20215.1 hypothetical protein [Gammaproteobacteria bacterium]